MRETLRVHGAAIEHELPQCGESGWGEEGAGSLAGSPHLNQPAFHHGLHRGGIFGWLRRSPPRQVRRKMPSAISGSWPK